MRAATLGSEPQTGHGRLCLGIWAQLTLGAEVPWMKASLLPSPHRLRPVAPMPTDFAAGSFFSVKGQG